MVQASNPAVRLALALAAMLTASAASAAPVIGEPAPALTATTMDGKTFDLAALKGKVVLIHYWATWCAPCRKEMPALDAFYKRYHGRGLEVLAISLDRGPEIAAARTIAAAQDYPSALLTDVKAEGFDRAPGVPLTYVIDVNGIVRDRFNAAPDDLLTGVVPPLLPN